MKSHTILLQQKRAKEEGEQGRREDSETGKKNGKRARENKPRKAHWKRKSNWPCSITSPLSLIIAVSPKQPKQTKSGLMYFPVTTAWREPNSCSQREMSFWKTPLVNMVLCMAYSRLGPPLSHFSSHLFSFTFHLFISKVKRDSILWMSQHASHTVVHSFSFSPQLCSYLLFFSVGIFSDIHYNLHMATLLHVLISLNNFEHDWNVAWSQHYGVLILHHLIYLLKLDVSGDI